MVKKRGEMMRRVNVCSRLEFPLVEKKYVKNWQNLELLADTAGFYYPINGHAVDILSR